MIKWFNVKAKNGVASLYNNNITLNTTAMYPFDIAHKVQVGLSEEGNVVIQPLTKAFIETGNLTSFTLESWDEETDADTKTKDDEDHDVLISLSWAINLYGAAYNITKTNDEAADVATGFANNYRNASLTDKFNYSQDLPADPVTPLNIVDSVSGESSDSTRTILYFSVEFDDSETTYYEYDDTTAYYTQSIDGNSNCYEKLILKDLVFTLA